MIKLDDNLLTELGLQSLPAEEKRALLRQIYETLEMRVGTTLARQMTDAQLDEFESFINNNDEAGALRWLETNFPNYKDVVSQEFDVLKGEIMQAAPQIVANAAQAQAHAQTQAPMQPQAMPAQPQQYQPTPQPDYSQQPQYAAPQPQAAPMQQPIYQQPQQSYYDPQAVMPAQPQQPAAMAPQQPQTTAIPQQPQDAQQPQAAQPQIQPTQNPYGSQQQPPEPQQFSQPL